LENLLEWSRMQRNAIEFNPESCLLNLIVKQNLDIAGEYAKQKDIELINNIHDNDMVTADMPMLNTVLRNLISNAIKFTPRGGKIEVGTVKSSDESKISEYCIYVKDSGIGMTQDIISKLFKIDQKVSRPGTENESSTGLGLLLCKEFIEKHGGKIWVESEVNKGSTFFFILPKSE
ncbi:MAG: HAMP domain-containing sensor histidine kinase, partial [Bacteroidota bacterium]